MSLHFAGCQMVCGRVSEGLRSFSSMPWSHATATIAVLVWVAASVVCKEPVRECAKDHQQRPRTSACVEPHAGPSTTEYPDITKSPEKACACCHPAGNLPPAWSNLARLEQLDISTNRVSGSLPVEWGTSGRWPLLQQLDMSGNRITGQPQASLITMGSFMSGQVRLIVS